MRIWLDMANSPHPVLFRPVAEELIGRGHELLVTTRDHGQTRDLTLDAWPDAHVVGQESPGPRVEKARAIGQRVRGLYRYVCQRDVTVAVSLNSYAQIVAARLARIPSVTLMDYEYQPANHLSFRLADRIVVPAVFPASRLRHYGARAERVARFEGLKEELYLDRTSQDGIGLEDTAARTRVVFRPPAEGAMYHAGANWAFERLVEEGARREDVDAIVLPRLSAQRERYATLPGVELPDRTVDGLAVLRAADVFIGAGGTMSREAALLGVRAYTMFAGRLPAVDKQLILAGSLKDLRKSPIESVDWSPRRKLDAQMTERHRRERGQALRRWFVELIERSVELLEPNAPPRSARRRA